MATLTRHAAQRKVSLVALLNPGTQWMRGLACLFAGLALGGLGMAAGMPLWGATTIALALLLWPGILKWRDDLLRWGLPAMAVSVLVYVQGFHTIEHIVQWAEYHLLQWHPRQSSGLISAANVEIIHFAFNWAVLLTQAYLWRSGMRSWWAVALLAWTTAHTAEHTYLMVQYLGRLLELRAEGADLAFAQGLPGILGRGGWLATSPATEGTFLCRLPALTTAIRLDVHFWWNVGETALLVPAAAGFARLQFGRGRARMNADQT